MPWAYNFLKDPAENRLRVVSSGCVELHDSSKRVKWESLTKRALIGDGAYWAY
jgi:hypothetical protein